MEKEVRKNPKCKRWFHRTVPAIRIETVADWLGKSFFIPVDHHEGWCLNCRAVVHA
jgi:hypothetical protein